MSKIHFLRFITRKDLILNVQDIDDTCVRKRNPTGTSSDASRGATDIVAMFTCQQHFTEILLSFGYSIRITECTRSTLDRSQVIANRDVSGPCIVACIHNNKLYATI